MKFAGFSAERFGPVPEAPQDSSGLLNRSPCCLTISTMWPFQHQNKVGHHHSISTMSKIKLETTIYELQGSARRFS